MKLLQLFKARSGRRNLQDFVRLLFGFFVCLLLLAVYQQLRLFGQGVLDSPLSANLLRLCIHHLGFASLTALCLAPLFNWLESRRPGWGFRTSIVVLVILILNELVLTEFYIANYALPGLDLGRVYGSDRLAELLVVALIGGVVLTSAFRAGYRLGKQWYQVIGKLFPVTIVLLSLFLATLLSEKRPVNVNKNQHLITEAYDALLGVPEYAGSDPYPFWRRWNPEDPLARLVDWGDTRPHIVVIAVEGLNSQFVGSEAPYRWFTPYLDSLRTRSVFWPKAISNGGNSESVPAALLGSLPLGTAEFNAEIPAPDRWTLFSLLKRSGYRTSFQYGGNAALHGWDRLLYEERIDEIVDQKGFGAGYQKQYPDAAGISLGYPDHLLYRRYFTSRVAGSEPNFDYFQTLSSRPPFNFPERARFIGEVEAIQSRLDLPGRERRILRRNTELAAALRYADASLKSFIQSMKSRKGYENTLFILTGTHHPRTLATGGILESHAVPMLIFGPLVKGPVEFDAHATHMDLAPALYHSLSEQYDLEGLDRAAWMSPGLPEKGTHDSSWPVPLYREGEGAYAWIVGDSVAEGNSPSRLFLGALTEKAQRMPDERPDFGLAFRAMETHVLEENRLIPSEEVLYEPLIAPPSETEQVWINSVFNGKNFDHAYQKARSLAFSGSWGRAQLLCRYILMHVPGHVDSEILLGRLAAWKGEYERATEILEQVIQKHPVYEDGYAALLDVYHWSGQNEKARYLVPPIQRHLGSRPDLDEKLKRAGIADTVLLSELEQTSDIVTIRFE